MMRLLLGILVAIFSIACSADADGPDAWQVQRVSEPGALNIRRGPSTEFGVIGKLPFDAKGLANLGCYPQFNAAEWTRMPEQERELATKMRWCKVQYKGQTGWVYGHYLEEY